MVCEDVILVPKVSRAAFIFIFPDLGALSIPRIKFCKLLPVATKKKEKKLPSKLI